MSEDFLSEVNYKFPDFFNCNDDNLGQQNSFVSRQAIEKAKNDIALIASWKCRCLYEPLTSLLILNTVIEYLGLIKIKGPRLHFDDDKGTIHFGDKILEIKGDVPIECFRILYNAWRKNSFTPKKDFEFKYDPSQDGISDDAIRQRLSKLRGQLREGGMPDLATAIKSQNGNYRIFVENKDTIVRLRELLMEEMLNKL